MGMLLRYVLCADACGWGLAGSARLTRCARTGCACWWFGRTMAGSFRQALKVKREGVRMATKRNTWFKEAIEALRKRNAEAVLRILRKPARGQGASGGERNSAQEAMS